MSLALNGSSAIQHFEGNDAIQIRDGITFDFYMGPPHVLIIQLLHMYSRITLRQRCLVKSGKNDENYQSVIKTLVKIVSLTGEKVRLSIAVSLYTMPVQ